MVGYPLNLDPARPMPPSSSYHNIVRRRIMTRHKMYTNNVSQSRFQKGHARRLRCPINRFSRPRHWGMSLSCGIFWKVVSAVRCRTLQGQGGQIAGMTDGDHNFQKLNGVLYKDWKATYTIVQNLRFSRKSVSIYLQGKIYNKKNTLGVKSDDFSRKGSVLNDCICDPL
jgi:hypothetical protein